MAENPILLAQVPAPPMSPPVVAIEAAPGQVIDLSDAARPDATLSIEGDDLLVTRPDGPPMVVRDLVDAALTDEPPVVQLADAAIPAPELVGRVAPFAAVPVGTLLQSYAPVDPPDPGALRPLSPPVIPTVAAAHHDPGRLRPLAEDDSAGFAVQPLPARVAAEERPPFITEAPPEDTSLALLIADDAPPSAPVSTGTPDDDVVTLAAPVSGTAIDLGAGTDTLVLADGGNRLAVLGVETVTGGSGDDTVTLDGAARHVDLGDGTDTLDLSALAGGPAGDADFIGIEKIDLQGGAASTLTLDVGDVLDLSPTTDTLLVRGDAVDTLTIGSGWTAAGTVTDPPGESGAFDVYTQSVGGATATLLVESQVAVE